MIYFANNLEETAAIAKAFLADQTGGGVVALSGNLGAGKTTFVQMIAKELGIKERVTSPTFVFLRTYKLPKPKNGIKTLAHIDAYRLDDSQELFDVGAQEVIEDPNTLTFIEWPERVPEFIPPSATHLTIIREDTKRLFYLNQEPPK